jgi:hypothetical protein
MRTRLIELPDSKGANLTALSPLSNGLSGWVKPCARQVFLRHVSAVDEKYGHRLTAVAVAANVPKLMSGDGCDAGRCKYHGVA